MCHQTNISSNEAKRENRYQKQNDHRTGLVAPLESFSRIYFFILIKLRLLIEFHTLTVKLTQIRSACFVLNQQDDRSNQSSNGPSPCSSWFSVPRRQRFSLVTPAHSTTVCRPFCTTPHRGNLIFWQFFYYFRISPPLYETICRKDRRGFCR